MFIRTKPDIVLAVVFFGPVGAMCALAMLHIPMLVAWDSERWGEAASVLARWWLLPVLAAFVLWNLLQWLELVAVWQHMYLAAIRLLLAIAGTIGMIGVAILLGIGA